MFLVEKTRSQQTAYTTKGNKFYYRFIDYEEGDFVEGMVFIISAYEGRKLAYHTTISTTDYNADMNEKAILDKIRDKVDNAKDNYPDALVRVKGIVYYE